MESDICWSEMGSGFGELDGTSLPMIPRNTTPLPVFGKPTMFIILKLYIACERRRISGCRLSPPNEKNENVFPTRCRCTILWWFKFKFGVKN